MELKIKNGYVMKYLTSNELREFVHKLKLASFEYFYIYHINLLNATVIYKLIQESIFYKALGSNEKMLENHIKSLSSMLLNNDSSDSLQFDSLLENIDLMAEPSFVEHLPFILWRTNKANSDFGKKLINKTNDPTAYIFIYTDGNSIKFQVKGEAIEDLLKFLIDKKNNSIINKMKHLKDLMEYEIKDYSYDSEKECEQGNLEIRKETWERLCPTNDPFADSLYIELLNTNSMLDYNMWLFDILSNEEIYNDILKGLSFISVYLNSEEFSHRIIRENAQYNIMQEHSDEISNDSSAMEHISAIIERDIKENEEDFDTMIKDNEQLLNSYIIDWKSDIIKDMLIDTKDSKYKISDIMLMSLDELSQLNIFLNNDKVERAGVTRKLIESSIKEVGTITSYLYSTTKLNSVLATTNKIKD